MSRIYTVMSRIVTEGYTPPSRERPKKNAEGWRLMTTKSVRDAEAQPTRQDEDELKALAECQRSNGDPNHPSSMKIERGPTMLKDD